MPTASDEVNHEAQRMNPFSTIITLLFIVALFLLMAALGHAEQQTLSNTIDTTSTDARAAM
jgi:hypothetical protein